MRSNVETFGGMTKAMANKKFSCKYYVIENMFLRWPFSVLIT